MSRLDCDANHTSTDGRATAADSAAEITALGLYLTDEVFLFRVADASANDADEMIGLEDCYGLDVVQVPLNDLRVRQLRVVTPTPGDD